VGISRVIVRAATADDADAIGRIHVETWRAAYVDLLPAELLASLSVEARTQWWRNALAGPTPPQRQTFVAEGDGRVLGFAAVGEWEDQPEPDVGQLYAIYVDASRWSTGAGRALIERAEQALRESGFLEARLWVLAGNKRAERFYRAAGWEQDNQKEDVIRGTEVVELRYSKRL
jgi:GNAT superfamily N-acetyltransferase